MATKPWWQSKTIWLNVLAVGFIVLQQVGAADVGLDPELEALVIIVVNLALRYFATDKRLTLN